MAMVRITKGDKKLLIPAGAYKKQYAPSGWNIEEEPAGKVAVEGIELSKEPVLGESKAADAWDEVDKEVEQEKSLDEMSFKELQGKAKELKIDVRNLKTIGDYKKAIKGATE